MSSRPLVILHGWSDDGESFDSLARHLAVRLPDFDVTRLAIGDYISMHDEVRFDDLQVAMARAWKDRGLPLKPHSVDAIVHSTGGLVIREWLDRQFAPDKSPIKHLVMLAPANFGSPLAHKGRSFIGRAFKGFFRRQPEQPMFNTGTEILKGLELASPFSWDLAMRDRFGAGKGRYGAGRVLCTVLMGNRGYKGIQSMANEVGSDGTVRISTANLNCARLDIRFDTRAAPREGDPDHVAYQPEPYELTESLGRTAFRVVDRIDHSAIKLDGGVRAGSARQQVLDLIIEALTVDDAGFSAFCDECDAATAALTQQPGQRKGTPAFQNTVVRVRDQFGVAVDDYLLEFFDLGRADGGALAKEVHTEAIRKIHLYRDDASYRSLYIDTAQLLDSIGRTGNRFALSITATPTLEGGRPVGFQTLGDDDIDDLALDLEEARAIFQPHRTLLLDIMLPRLQRPQVFSLRDADT